MEDSYKRINQATKSKHPERQRYTQIRDKGDQFILLVDTGRGTTLGDKDHLMIRSQSRNASGCGTDLVLDLDAGHSSMFK